MAKFLFDYDSDTEQVIMCDQPIGKLDNPDVLSILKRGNRNDCTFSPAILRATHYVTFDYSVCPKCKGEFKREWDKNGVEVGRCHSCGAPSYRFEDKVHIIYDDSTGAKTWHNLLA